MTKTTLKKPPSVAKNKFKSKKWDELIKNYSFTEKNIPALELLCHWYAVMDSCLDATTQEDKVKATCRSSQGEIRPDPRLAIIKQAYTEIRALHEQLKINDEVTPQTAKVVSVLNVIQGKREQKAKVAC